VTFDKLGNLYGTTQQGGSDRHYSLGTVYRLSPGSQGWTETVLLTFFSPYNLGGIPLGAVSFDASGRLYGTTSVGGVLKSGGVFRLSTGKSQTFMFDGTDGALPHAGVLIDSKNGAIYGTTYGNNSTAGNIFKIDSKGKETVLYAFCQQSGCPDGGRPRGALIADEAGNLYGTTEYGGANDAGVVFEITP
jgi:uncharacterized repeat protein (TIGR03803 family)